MSETPFEKGQQAFLRGDYPPSFPRPDDSWASRLFYLGWESEARKKARSLMPAPDSKETT